MRYRLDTPRGVAVSAARLLAIPAVLAVGLLAVAPPWVALLVVGVPVALLAAPLAVLGGVAVAGALRLGTGALRLRVVAHRPSERQVH